MIRSGFSWLINPLTVMSSKQSSLGLSFPLQLPQLGEVLVTGDPRQIKCLIAQKEFNAGEGIKVLSHFLGKQSVICLDGNKHQQRHHLLSKYLYSDKITLYDDALRMTCRQHLALIKKQSRFNFYSFSRHALLDIALLQLLGPIEPALYSHLRSCIQATCELNIHPMVLFVKPLQFNCFGWSSWGRLMHYQRQIRTTLSKVIQSNNFGSDSLLFYLTQQGNDYYKNKEALIDEIMALIFFAHETTAATIATIAEFIVGNDEMIDRLLIDRQYLLACIKEGMRLRPVVPHITRISRIEQHIGNHPLHKGQWVFPSSYLAHLNEEAFPRHEEFLPERFLPDKDYPYSSFPFGIGDRICLGKKLANRHMEIIMTEIFTALRFQRDTVAPSTSKRRLVLMVPATLDSARVITNRLQTKLFAPA